MKRLFLALAFMVLVTSVAEATIYLKIDGEGSDTPNVTYTNGDLLDDDATPGPDKNPPWCGLACGANGTNAQGHYRTGSSCAGSVLTGAPSGSGCFEFDLPDSQADFYHELHLPSAITSLTGKTIYMAFYYQAKRVGGVKEIILAMNPNMEGEATAMYIQKQLPKNLTVTRLAHGLPVGADIEYADEVTLSRALEGRRTY